MKNLSYMSRAELVRELMAEQSAANIADAPATYLSSPGSRKRARYDPSVVYRLSVARELILRDLVDRMKSAPILSSPEAVRDWLRLQCADLEHETFIVLHLDARHRLIEAQELFRGTLTQTSVYPREVVKACLERNAGAVVLAHNHPSGVAEASRADELLTRTLKSALSLVDVCVVDHFVVAGDQTLSFAQSGLL